VAESRSAEKAAKFMHRIVVVSSYVAHGTIGLQATCPAFPRDRFEISAIPTVVLSNQPGLKACAGSHLPPEMLLAIISALDANGWISNVDAVFTGYMPTSEHVAAAEDLIAKVKSKNPAARIVVDPILGDDPDGLYIATDAAEAVRDRLLPNADVVTPNRFELAWLTKREIGDAASAADAARTLARPIVVATSIPAPDRRICNVLVSEQGAAIETVHRSEAAPHGTGDFFAGRLTAELVLGRPPEEALTAATRATADILANSVGKDHLLIVKND
jgi:pyridoxine kinase